MHTVAAVATQGVLTFDLAVPCEVFGWDRSFLGVEWYDFKVCAAEPPPLRTQTGFTIDTPFGLDDIATADTIIVPGWSDVEQLPSDELLAVLRDAYTRGARIASICIGAFVLGWAGLLDGRPCTTHWAYVDEFAKRFPQARLDPKVLYIDDGQILTSAGTAAGIDLCLHLVRQDHGAQVANGVARRIVMPPHRDGGQAQYIEQPVLPRQGDDVVRTAMTWALAHLDQPIALEQLARQGAVSVRTFSRQFRAATGATPGEWLLQQRLLRARTLLETTDFSVDRVAHEAGFATAAALRYHFTDRLRTTPNAYRRTFRGAPPVLT